MKKFATLQYSEALLDIAIEEKKVLEYKKQITLFLEVLNENPHYLQLFSLVTIDKTKKQDLLKTAFTIKFTKNFYNFLFVLIDKRLFTNIKKILLEVLKLINRQLKVVEGIIYSTVNLSELEIKQITQKISAKINKKVILKNQIDQGIFGGIKVVVDNQVFDNSTLNQLNSLKYALLKGEN